MAAAALVLSLIECRPNRTPYRTIQAANDEPAELRDLRRQGNALLQASQYARAIEVYENGYREAERHGNVYSELRFLNNLGGVHYRLFRYRDAVQEYLKARDLARLQNDREMLGALYNNLSSLYFDMGEMNAALISAEQGLTALGKTNKFRASLLLQSARIKERQKESQQRIRLLEEAIEASRRDLDVVSESQAWNELGDALFDRGQIQSAERAMLEAFRLRRLTKDDRIYFSYQSLGRLRLWQGDSESATVLLDRAVDSARFISPAAMWSAYYERGKLKALLGRQQEAFADFENALERLRSWRAEVLPADTFRVSSEVEVNEVYNSYIEAAGRLYEQTHQKRFADLAFSAGEESRAASLRALWAGPDMSRRLPNEYWETLADLHKAEADLMKDPSSDESNVRRLRFKIAEMELHAGLDLPRNLGTLNSTRTGLLDQTQRALGSSEVFLAFHLNKGESWAWAITRKRLAFYRLPPRGYFADEISSFVKAIREDSPDIRVLGKRLYSQLFDRGAQSLIDKPEWIVAPDGPLFDLPFVALVKSSQPRLDVTSYVVEHHAIRVVPGVSALFPDADTNPNGPVVGLGDPIYNRADPRFSHPPNRDGVKHSGGSLSATEPRLELARLAGSGREIERLGEIWRSQGREAVLLTGAAATRVNLKDALRQNPAILHIAAHVVFPAQNSALGFLALALQPAGDVELLSPMDIANIKGKLGLVVLNGCSSAHAAILPGAGLMGMTRAWLAAGARGVIVTRWAIPDQDDGDIFVGFYHSLYSSECSQRRKSFAQFLQQTQRKALHGGGSRARPAYWAAYFCVERN